jgi:hypothetical protein
MSIPRHSLFQPYGLLPQVALRCFVVVIATLFSGVAASMGPLALLDSMALFEAVESAEKATLFLHATTQPRRHRPRSWFPISAQRNACIVVGNAGRPAYRGHRLSSNLLAPLRC